MKILKNIFFAFLVIVAIVLVGIYFLPESYSVSRSIEIEKPISEIIPHVNDFNQWSAWSPWYEMEPEAQLVIEGTPGTVGHKMSWNGKKNGVGSLTLTSVAANGMEGNLEFVKPLAMKSKDIWFFKEENQKTEVTWTSTGHLSYPLGRLFGLSLDQMLGEQKEHGLKKLKEVCEK